ncbi:hypothetical protein GA0061083_2842 [Pseudarthrobacter enclensis]|uniref:HhH-GPD domain-containing protein n=1 Tax=Pseudarthrobacter enclensis TaxID=993070 RepID=A0A0V8IKX5_9MICC|nr:hypothetical protein [Pseudarthrobacter enclensis]KSU75394.1 hypothetical protein AS031_12535 [Pseudarthrobacter enclensis]SCC13517.1 hypothetical protein GA0061083_2842 [Pseudarthrobacter enclensis]
MMIGDEVVNQDAMAAVAKAVKQIPQKNFSVWPGGWPDEIGTSLIDAVYSIRSVYKTQDSSKGVLGRLRVFRENHPEAVNDLHALTQLDEKKLRDIMGNGKTAGHYKSECVLTAANNFLKLDAPVIAAGQLDSLDPQHKRAYTTVRGLGGVTYEYFTMLLGKPGIKADTMIRGFVDAALAQQRMKPVSAQEARDIVAAVHASDPLGVKLHEFDHGIWLYQRAINKQKKKG